MNYSLPKTVEIDGIEYKIRDECDYRTILDVFESLKDKDLTDELRLKCALYNFYQEIYDRINATEDVEQTIIDWEYTPICMTFYEEMIKIINFGQEVPEDDYTPNQMDWAHDWHLIAPPISRVLGYDVRDPDKYTHLYTMLGAYGEIGDCYWAYVMNIRNKKRKGKKLDKTDRQFYKEHKKDIDLPMELSEDEKEWLDSDW